jgi:DNA-binding MarR family transcriptional regulator
MENHEELSQTNLPPIVQALAEFRYRLRSFLLFSEHAATEAGLHPQQHQLLLQIAGASNGTATTIAYAAERLGLRHNSVVELANRSVAEGLLVRTEDVEDRRRVILSVTPKGRQVLDSLSGHHARELREMAPQLIRALQNIEGLSKPRKIPQAAPHRSLEL